MTRTTHRQRSTDVVAPKTSEAERPKTSAWGPGLRGGAEVLDGDRARRGAGGAARNVAGTERGDVIS